MSLLIRAFLERVTILPDGLVAIGGESTSLVVDRQGRSALLGTIQAVRPLLAETPFVREGKIERLIELASDPKLLTVGGSTLALWGQRPA